MIRTNTVNTIVYPQLAEIEHEYNDLLNSSHTFSLSTLLNSESLRMEDFCKDFHPHQRSSELICLAEEFGKRNNVWLEDAKNHVTCALYVFPDGDFSRMKTMMKILIIGFYLNDIMGRDRFKFLNQDEQELANSLVDRLSRIDTNLNVVVNGSSIEYINQESLKELKDSSPKNWFFKFLELYNYHILITHRNGDYSARGMKPTVDEYCEERCHLGGVHYILKFIEYSDGHFIDWDQLSKIGLAGRMERLHWLAAAFAGLANDMFSFEKEVIDSQSDSNLIPIILLNNPGIGLKHAIAMAAKFVKELLQEIIELKTIILNIVAQLSDRKLTEILYANIQGVTRCVQSIWTWHNYSDRYKRTKSIWKECNRQVL